MTEKTPSSGVNDDRGTRAVDAEQRPPANAGWAVVALLFFWPLSFAAFTHAFNVHPRWSDGDREGARYASNRVRWLGQVSLWIGGSILVVLVALYILLSALWIDGHRDRRMEPTFTGSGWCDIPGDFGSFGGGEFDSGEGLFGP